MKNTISFLFSCIFLLGCDATDYSDKNNNYKFLAYELFDEYSSFKYKDGLLKEKAHYSTVFVDKSDLKFETMNGKMISLKDKGWVETKSLFEDQYAFCNGEKNKITITFPRKTHYTNNEGEEMNVNKEYLSKWIILFQYNFDGVVGCY